MVEGRGPPNKKNIYTEPLVRESPTGHRTRPDKGPDREPEGGGGPPPETEAREGGPRKASQNPPNGREGGLHLRGSVMSVANSGRGGLKRANLGRGGLTLPIWGVAALNVPCALQAGMRPEGYEARSHRAACPKRTNKA